MTDAELLDEIDRLHAEMARELSDDELLAAIDTERARLAEHNNRSMT